MIAAGQMLVILLLYFYRSLIAAGQLLVILYLNFLTMIAAGQLLVILYLYFLAIFQHICLHYMHLCDGCVIMLD